jgi:hypothetical protein
MGGERASLGSRRLFYNSPNGRSVHSRNRRPVHHGFQHQFRSRWDADAEGTFCRTAMRGAGTDGYDDKQDSNEDSETLHGSILWRTIRRLCHGSSSNFRNEYKHETGQIWERATRPKPTALLGIQEGKCPFEVRGVQKRTEATRFSFKPSFGLNRAVLYPCQALRQKKSSNPHIPNRKTQDQFGVLFPPKMVK